MFTPAGFEVSSILTDLGSISYVRETPDFWRSPPTESSPPPPPLVFLHGFGGGSSHYEWSKIYPAFADSHQVFAPDLLGWGNSDHPPRSYTLTDYLQTLTEFLTQTCEEPAIVVASSLTAAMMVRVAIAHPQQIKALILIAPTGLKDFGQASTPEFLGQILRIPLLDKAIYWGAIAVPEAIRAFLQGRQFANPALISDEIVAAYLASARQPNAEYAALAFVRGDLSFDLATDLPQLTTPTFIVWGENAQFTTVETGRQLANLNPTAVQVFDVLPEMGLTPQLEYPAVMTGLIRKYLCSL